LAGFFCVQFKPLAQPARIKNEFSFLNRILMVRANRPPISPVWPRNALPHDDVSTHRRINMTKILATVLALAVLSSASSAVMAQQQDQRVPAQAQSSGDWLPDGTSPRNDAQ
jgi:hypothetical protein